MKKYYLYSLFFILLSQIQYVSAQSLSNEEKKIRQVENNLFGHIHIEGDTALTILSEMHRLHVNGVAIAVIENYKTIWSKGYAWADEASKTPVTSQTLFQAASISKSLNALGVIKLVSQKKFDIDKDINEYLHSWKFPYDSLSNGKKINIANLLSHTAGLSVHAFAGYPKGAAIPTILQILDGKQPANSNAIRSLFEPGLKFEYSGGGVLISQLIITDNISDTYEQYMQDQVLKPLGMDHSFYGQRIGDVDNKLMASGYDRSGREVPGRFYIYPELAAAGLWTNPSDLAKFITATQKSYQGMPGKILDKVHTRMQLTPYMNGSSALGVMIDDFSGNKYFEHGGANNGFRSQFYGSMEGGNGVVVMINSDNAEIIDEIVNSVARVYDFKGLDRSIIKKRIVVRDELLKDYAGAYKVNPKLSLNVTVENGQLYVQVSGQPKLAFYPESNTTFFPKEIDVKIDFVSDASGSSNSIKIFQNGKTFIADKVKQ